MPNKNDIIKDLSTFIEGLQVDNLILNISKLNTIQSGKVSYMTIPINPYQDPTIENTVVIIGDDLRMFNKYKKSLYENLNKKEHTFSKDHITKTIQNAILLHVKKQRDESVLYKDVKQFLNKIFSEIPQEFSVFFEIEGLKLDKTNNLEIGNCRFFKVTPHKFNKLMAFSNDENRFEKKEFMGKIFSQTKVKANDLIAAKRNATTYINKILDFINFFSGIIKEYYVVSGNVRIPKFIESPKDNWNVLYSENDKKLKTISYGIIHNYDFDFNSLKKVNKVWRGFKIARDLFKYNNDFIESLITSIQWAGKAMWEIKIEIAFIDYITSLEALLLNEKEGELSFRLALYGSYFLSSKTENRLWIYKRLKYYYGIRSKIVHSGNYEIEDDDLEALKYYVTNIIFAILFDKKYNFLESIDRRVFDEKLKQMVME